MCLCILTCGQKLEQPWGRPCCWPPCEDLLHFPSCSFGPLSDVGALHRVNQMPSWGTTAPHLWRLSSPLCFLCDFEALTWVTRLLQKTLKLCPLRRSHFQTLPCGWTWAPTFWAVSGPESCPQDPSLSACLTPQGTQPVAHCVWS